MIQWWHQKKICWVTNKKKKKKRKEKWKLVVGSFENHNFQIYTCHVLTEGRFKKSYYSEFSWIFKSYTQAQKQSWKWQKLATLAPFLNNKWYSQDENLMHNSTVFFFLCYFSASFHFSMSIQTSIGVPDEIFWKYKKVLGWLLVTFVYFSLVLFKKTSEKFSLRGKIKSM